MLVTTLLLALVLVLGLAFLVVLYSRDQSSSNPGTPEIALPVVIGGNARQPNTDPDVLLTDGCVDCPMHQYGYADIGPMSQFGPRFEVSCDLMVEEHMFGDVESSHAFLWISFYGDPTEESAKSSMVYNDGGMRLYVIKAERHQQKPGLDAYKSQVGVASIADDDQWDMYRDISYFPMSHWLHLNCTVDMSSRRFIVSFDEDAFTFQIPSGHNWQTKGARLYIGAKTMTRNGIRVKNVHVKSLPP